MKFYAVAEDNPEQLALCWAKVAKLNADADRKPRQPQGRDLRRSPSIRTDERLMTMTASADDKDHALRAMMIQQVQRVQERAAQMVRRLATADSERGGAHGAKCEAGTTGSISAETTSAALRLREHAVRERADYLAAAAGFLDAAAMTARASRSISTDPAENRRLAHAFRDGQTTAIAEPELAATAEVLDLGTDYFAGTAARNGGRVAALGSISALRHLLADEIGRGERPMLKPAFKQEFEAFKRDYGARRRIAAANEKPPADCPSSQGHEP